MITDYNSFAKIEKAFPSAIELSQYLRENGISVEHEKSGYELSKKLLTSAIVNLQDLIDATPIGQEPQREFVCLVLDIDPTQLDSRQLAQFYALREVPNVGLLSIELFCDDMLERMSTEYSLVCQDKDLFGLLEKQCWIVDKIATSDTPNFGAKIFGDFAPVSPPIHPVIPMSPATPGQLFSPEVLPVLLGPGLGSRLSWVNFPQPGAAKFLRPPVEPSWYTTHNLPPNIFDMMLAYEQAIMFDYFSHLFPEDIRPLVRQLPGASSLEIADFLRNRSPETAFGKFTMSNMVRVNEPLLPIGKQKGRQTKVSLAKSYSNKLRQVYLDLSPPQIADLMRRAYIDAGANLDFVQDAFLNVF